MHSTFRFRRLAVILSISATTFCSTLSGFAQEAAESPQLDFGVYSSFVDATYAKSLLKIVEDSQADSTVQLFDTLEKAAASDANVLILAMPRTRGNPFSEEILEAMKQKKVIGVAYGSAQLFEKLGLEINGGACAHFSQRELKLQLQNKEGDLLTPYAKQKPADNFGMYLPATSQLAYLLNPIARFEGSENYAPLVRQGNYVMIGLSGHPDTWSEDYQQLFRELARAMTKMKRVPFSKLKFQILEPGTYQYPLAKGRSKDALFSKRMYLRFDKPTQFTAKLEHNGSQNMMLIFMGEKDRLHWTRKDAKKGEPLTISVNITEQDIQAIGDQYWSLKITNFDQNNTAQCTLKIEYDSDQVQAP